MSAPPTPVPHPLNEAGLNLLAIFNLAELPESMGASLTAIAPDLACYRQLILVGHGGRRLWEALQAAGPEGEHPIDTFTERTVRRWLTEEAPGCRMEFLYPGDRPIGLQSLGKAAGWHHPSPFMVGVCDPWGSWYAYRAAVLADTDFPATAPESWQSPCLTCTTQPCISACPADALGEAAFRLERCATHRKAEASSCAATCLARVACPVGREHRYEADQLAHTYLRSLAALREYD